MMRVRLGIFLALLSACSESMGPVESPAAARANPESAADAASSTAEGARIARPAGVAEGIVERVIDGDTIVVAGVRVRYIGIDTPETKHPRKGVEHFGPEASEANRRLVEGRVVGLEYDVERHDHYGRTLAYVWVGDLMANAWLVENGYAQASTYPPNVRYADVFVELQRIAREEGRGLWGPGPVATPPQPTAMPSVSGATSAAETVYVTETGSRFHRAGCGYLRASRIPMDLDDAETEGYEPCRRCW